MSLPAFVRLVFANRELVTSSSMAKLCLVRDFVMSATLWCVLYFPEAEVNGLKQVVKNPLPDSNSAASLQASHTCMLMLTPPYSAIPTLGASLIPEPSQFPSKAGIIRVYRWHLKL